MRTEATVIATYEKSATVEIEKKSACDGCHKQAEGGCSVCTLLGDQKPMTVSAGNPIGAEIGDRVILESDTSKMLWYAVCVFLLPLIFTALAYGIAKIFTSVSWICTLSGCVGFALTFIALRIWSKKMQSETNDVTIIEIVNHQK